MSDSLVERLREDADYYATLPVGYLLAGLLLAAADQIEADAAHIAKLTLERDSAREQFDRHVEWASKQIQAHEEFRAGVVEAVDEHVKSNQ